MNIESKMLTDTKVRTGKVRFSYAHVFEPYGQDGNKKYSVSLLIPKEDETTIKNIIQAIETADKHGQNTVYAGKKVINPLSILHDGDEERPSDPNYKGCKYINANSQFKPSVLNKFKEEINDETEFYSGCYGIVSINFYPYNVNGKRGVACGLNNIMKLEDGERLGGSSSSKEDFSDIVVDELSLDLDDDLL